MEKKSTKKTVKKQPVAKKTTVSARKPVRKLPKKILVDDKAIIKETTTKTKLREKKVEHLTSEDLQHFRSLLLEKRAELLGDMDSMEGEALRKSRNDATGDLSSMPIHMADIGTDNYEQEFALNLLDSERKILVEIDAALRRIMDETYGICQGTGQPIARARLEANPWAKYCIEYAKMVEKGLVIEGERVTGSKDEDDFDDDISEEIEDYEEDSDKSEKDTSSDDDEDEEEEEDEEKEKERGFRDFNSYFGEDEDIAETDPFEQ